jgi:hypothetical protein
LARSTLASTNTREVLHNFIDHLAFNECQAFVAAQVRIGELVLVQPELMKDRRVHVAEVTGLFDGVKADGVGRADNLSALWKNWGQSSAFCNLD